jgi:predicted RNA methylase
LKISARTLAILSNCLNFVEPNRIVIGGQLDRKEYVKVNEVLEALGGKWDRKSKSHMFGGRGVEALKEDIDQVIATGQVTSGSDLGWFPTPDALADTIVAKLAIKPGDTVLEPSAGDGALAKAVLRRHPQAKVMCVEIHPGRAQALRAAGFKAVTEADFLQIDPAQADVRVDHVVMNPPFAPKRADLVHIEHALKFLRPGGTLVSVMAGGISFRQDTRSDRFRMMVSMLGGELSELPEGSFLKSGTGVNTVLLSVTRAWG